jgi:phosphate uptake regulator/aminoglycoside phosphotransferase
MPLESTPDRNFRFLVREVQRQVERTRVLLAQPSEQLRRQIARRDDYIDHLRTVIENRCFADLGARATTDKRAAAFTRATAAITANLERIADNAVSIVAQSTHFSTPTFLAPAQVEPFFELVALGLGSIVEAYRGEDVAPAVEICKVEGELDIIYAARFQETLAAMSDDPALIPDLVTALFIYHYLERMGDSLLNIGEAIILANLGERLKFHQFQSLQEAVAGGIDLSVELSSYEGVWGTRSGCNIGILSEPPEAAAGEGERSVVYKQGERSKIALERQKIEEWEEVLPGLVPQVVEYREEGEEAAILVEFLEGETLQEILFGRDHQLLSEAVCRLQETLRFLWHDSMQPEPHSAGFIAQLLDRIEDVYGLHPQLHDEQQEIGGLRIPYFPELLQRNLDLDVGLPAPFTVHGHGDFNLDNIIYNARTQDVHFIDLHRSGPADYVADMAVLLVSNFRMPVFDTVIRDRLNLTIESLYAFTRGFAEFVSDETFQARMALGLIRSFTTSTRFELDRAFAESMLWRASYLLERLDAHRGRPWEQFSLPHEVLFY